MADNPGNTILVTRPEAQARRYALALRAEFAGRARVISSPLLVITPLEAALDLRGVRALLFTSGNAVRAFTARSERRDIPSYCVGNKTTQVARTAGFTAMSATGSVDDLAKLVTSHLGKEGGVCLHVRAKHTSGNIAGVLAQRGYETREVIVYDQQSCALTHEARLALKGPQRVIVPLFSPRTAEIFCAETQNLTLRNVSIVCISDAVAGKLSALSFCDLKVARAPNAASVTREIDAML